MSFIEIEKKVVRNPAKKRGFFNLLSLTSKWKKEQCQSLKCSG